MVGFMPSTMIAASHQFQHGLILTFAREKS